MPKEKIKAVRFRLPFSTKAIQVDTPEVILTAIEEAGIKNRTAYIINLVAIDLLKQKGTDKYKTELATIIEVLQAKK